MKIRFIIIFIISLLFASCLQISTGVDFHQDGSGKVVMEYRISDSLDKEFIALPVEKQDFLDTAEKIKGLNLEAYNIKQDGDSKIVTARIGFADENSLLLLLNSGTLGSADIIHSGNITVYKQIFSSGIKDDMDMNTIENIRPLLNDCTIRTSIHAPKKIISANLGETSVNSCTLSLNLGDVIFSQNPVVWEVEW